MITCHWAHAGPTAIYFSYRRNADRTPLTMASWLEKIRPNTGVLSIEYLKKKNNLVKETKSKTLLNATKQHDNLIKVFKNKIVFFKTPSSYLLCT